MNSNSVLLLAADVTLVLHFLIVCFVIFGLILILTGRVMRWHWVRNLWFRLTHIFTIGVVVVQSWFGIVCPLTTLEMWFREKAGETVYSSTFISHWIGRFLFYQAPLWVFAMCYTIFGLLVLMSWFWVRPTALFKAMDSNDSTT